MQNKFDKKVVNELFGIDEPFKAPGRLMEINFNPKLREKLFRQFLEISTDVSYDWFQGYFEENQADHKNKKQDFTPRSVSDLVTELADGKDDHTYFESASGTGGITIKKWWRDCIKESPLNYSPQEHLYWCEELSDGAVPFLIFNLALRGMNAVVWNGDSLSRKCRGVFLIMNSTNNALGFSDVNVMPYNEEVKKYFNVSEWVGERFPEHVETSLSADWRDTFAKYNRSNKLAAATQGQDSTGN